MLRLSLRDNQILDIIDKAGLEQYAAGGNCFTTSLAIHNVLLPKGKIVVAFNVPVFNKLKKFVGHCAIEQNGYYFDGEGQKGYDELEAWGMLDPEDPYYIELMGVSPRRWEQLSYKTAVRHISEDELRKYGDIDDVLLKQLEGQIRRAMK